MKSLWIEHDERVTHGKLNNRTSPDHMNRTYESVLHTRCYNEPVDMDFYNFVSNLPSNSTWCSFWVRLLVRDCWLLFVLDFVSALDYYPPLHRLHQTYFASFLLIMLFERHESRFDSVHSTQNIDSKEIHWLPIQKERKQAHKAPSDVFSMFLQWMAAYGASDYCYWHNVDSRNDLLQLWYHSLLSSLLSLFATAYEGSYYHMLPLSSSHNLLLSYKRYHMLLYHLAYHAERLERPDFAYKDLV
jgi:hypothetical protein